MNFDNLVMFIAKLKKRLKQRPEQALTMFEEEWPEFNPEERELLSGFFIVANGDLLEFNRPIKPVLVSLRLLQISQKPVVDGKFSQEIFPGLGIADDINGNQITELFYRLKQRGHILGTWEQIAEAISLIFPIDQGTALKDLTETNRRRKISRLQF